MPHEAVSFTATGFVKHESCGSPGPCFEGPQASRGGAAAAAAAGACGYAQTPRASNEVTRRAVGGECILALT